MNKKRLITSCVFLTFFIKTIGYCFAQQQPVIFSSIPNQNFSFTEHWDYAWNITKDNEGKFHNAEENLKLARDTVHLLFTANCRTNVQGGYRVRYCEATEINNTINLTFADGLPAYGSSFHVLIENNRFTFKPEVVYPELDLNNPLSYKTKQAKLILSQTNKAELSGYISASFNEVDTKGKVLAVLYFKGYFKTPLKH